MSKGSTRRKEDTEKIRDNWEAIFGRKETKEQQPKQEAPKDNAK
jgi:hypothetical protein